MRSTSISVLSVIWETSVEKVIRIGLPLIGEKRVCVSATPRIVKENSTVFVEVDTMGKRWRYPTADACHTVLKCGLGELHLCIAGSENRVRIVLQACISVGDVEKSWPLIAKEVLLVELGTLKDGELMILGFATPGIEGFALDRTVEMGAVESDLTEFETENLLRATRVR